MLNPGCGVEGTELSADGHLPADLDQMVAEDAECSLWRADGREAGGAGMNPNFTSRSGYLFLRQTAGYCLLLLGSLMFT